MDMSKIVWPLIIVAIVGVGWLMTSGGVNYMYKKFTTNVPGEDEAQDKIDEAGLTRLGGYLMKTFQFGKAYEVMDKAVNRYETGANAYYNYYRMAKCADRVEDYKLSADILAMLIESQAHTHDERVPMKENLDLRLQKLIEVHELEGFGK